MWQNSTLTDELKNKLFLSKLDRDTGNITYLIEHTCAVPTTSESILPKECHHFVLRAKIKNQNQKLIEKEKGAGSMRNMRRKITDLQKYL